VPAIPDGVRLADSVNSLGPESRLAVVVASSHGGIYAAHTAARRGARAVILNDAGVGLAEAGVAGLAYCEALGMAAAVVSHLSARIGDAADMLARGVISRANRLAEAVGCVPGIPCADAARRLRTAPLPALPPPPYEETRFLVSNEPDRPRVICIDSASLVRTEDADQVVITGSHGGLIGGRREKAFNVRALLAAFNDAGVGIDRAGIGRLDPLDERRIAAVTAAHTSARIGDARSTYADGIISHMNSSAAARGARIGMPVAVLVGLVLEAAGPSAAADDVATPA